MANSQVFEINLKDKEVKELLKLEELFHSQYMTEELINAMISLYVRFVENINSNQHPLRLFFMEKIKFVLSRPEIIRILEKDTEDNNRNMRDTIRGVIGLTEEDQIEMKKLAEEAKKEIRQNHIINMKKQRVVAQGVDQNELKDKERNMKIEMQVKIMQEVQMNMRKMKKEMNNEGQQRKKQEAEITNMMQRQDNALNERLAKRKKKLRKKSVELKDVEVIEVQSAPPIAKAELIAMKKEVSQTYERFTRLTMNKTKRGTQSGRENQGKVKIKIEQNPIYEEDIFDEVNKKEKKEEAPVSFSKKKKTEEVQAAPVNVVTAKVEEKKEEVRNVDSSVEYKPFDQKQGRVTVRNKVYEQIEDDEAF